MDLQFEPLTDQHAREVMDIFNYYVENSFAAYPEHRLSNEFFGKLLEMAKGYPAYAIKNQAGRVIGFCMLKAHSPFPAFRETAEISYFIAHDATGKGAGTEALVLLEQEGLKMGLKRLLASISSLNELSLRFHHKNGFRECGRFLDIGRKKGQSFDVVWMEKEIG